MQSDAPIGGLVLLAALLHASWNAMLHGNGDRFLSMTWMSVAMQKRVPARMKQRCKQDETTNISIAEHARPEKKV